MKKRLISVVEYDSFDADGEGTGGICLGLYLTTDIEKLVKHFDPNAKETWQGVKWYSKKYGFREERYKEF